MQLANFYPDKLFCRYISPGRSKCVNMRATQRMKTRYDKSFVRSRINVRYSKCVFDLKNKIFYTIPHTHTNVHTKPVCNIPQLAKANDYITNIQTLNQSVSHVSHTYECIFLYIHNPSHRSSALVNNILPLATIAIR